MIMTSVKHETSSANGSISTNKTGSSVVTNSSNNDNKFTASEDKPSGSLSYFMGISSTNSSSQEILDSSTELSSLKCKHIIMHHSWPRQAIKNVTEVDAAAIGAGSKYCLTYMEIFSTILSIIMRAIAVCINIKLALDYYNQGHTDYFIWTVICIVVPMCITILIHANMCYQDGEFSRGWCSTLQTLWLVLFSSFFFRYWRSLGYAIKCKQAEIAGDKPSQLKYYKLNIREESDVAFLRLFECFLEAAPQKVLQISIVLGHIDKMTNIQIIAICSYFGSMAWCLSVYHRYNRYSQSDKYNISLNGVILQLCWHFCITVSRTLCISFVASVFPVWTLVACLGHALLFGFVTFVVDRPQLTVTSFFNFLFCLVLGVVYVFMYISVRDAPTRYKYLIYYTVCSMENIVCLFLFVSYASKDLVELAYLFYSLCAMALLFYYFGIVFMVIYYLYFHPRITAKRCRTNN